MDEFQLRKISDGNLRDLYFNILSKLYNKEIKNFDEFNISKDFIGVLYSEFVRRRLSIPTIGSVKQNPSINILSPESDITPATNIRPEEGIGGLPNLDAMRMNYLTRRKLMMTEREQQGQSSGGANYVDVLYQKKENSKIYNPNPCGGYRNYFYAYGDQQKTYCVKNLDEY